MFDYCNFKICFPNTSHPDLRAGGECEIFSPQKQIIEE